MMSWDADSTALSTVNGLQHAESYKLRVNVARTKSATLRHSIGHVARLSL